jgi:hypothetical protein
MPSAATGTKSRKGASTVITGQCSVRYIDHITSGASICLLAERFGARRGRHPATASTYPLLGHGCGTKHPTPVAPLTPQAWHRLGNT